jgi:pimeloyl-ACP methyl ester carboxylesterase
MVGDLAILSPDRASVVISDYPYIETWVIGGHSLGGTIACSYAKKFPDKVQGVVLWAAYPSPAFSIRDTSLKVTSVFGTNDGLATPEEIEESRADLPPDTQFVPQLMAAITPSLAGMTSIQIRYSRMITHLILPDSNSSVRLYTIRSSLLSMLTGSNALQRFYWENRINDLAHYDSSVTQCWLKVLLASI